MTGFDVYYVAVYIRLSREDGDKEESDSISNQRTMLLDFINRQEGMFLYDTYIDDGYTGTNFERPGFQRMVSDINAGNVNCVVVKDLSRFGRDYIGSGQYLEREFPRLGVRFIAVTDMIDSAKQAYDMLLPIKNIFNEQYARDISKKIHATVKSKQKAGQFIGSFPSYGYKKSSVDKNKLIIDEYAANVVRRIFDLYLEGRGKQQIAKILNKEGILCPSEYKKLCGENYKNPHRLNNMSLWTYSTIDCILKNEMYIGNMVQGTRTQQLRGKQKTIERENWIVVANTHDPIVSQEVWKQAQVLLKHRTRDIGLDKNMNVFAGFVKCADCGRSMVKSIWYSKNTKEKHYTLHCGTHRRAGKGFCSAHYIALDTLEKIVLSDLKAIIRNVENLQGLVKEKTVGCSDITRMLDHEIEKTSNELERMIRMKKSSYEDYREGLLNKDEFLRYREDYLKREKLYLEQLEVLKKRKEERIETDNVFEIPWLKRLLQMKDIEQLDRSIVTEMIHEILIYEEKKVKIVYNFSDELSSIFSENYQEKAEIAVV